MLVIEAIRLGHRQDQPAPALRRLVGLQEDAGNTGLRDRAPGSDDKGPGLVLYSVAQARARRVAR